MSTETPVDRVKASAVDARSGGVGGVADGRGERVLFVAPFAPWARENGSSVVIADLLDGLADDARAQILPVFVRRSPRPGIGEPALEGIVLETEPLPKWYSVPWALIQGKSPWWEVRFANRRLARTIAQSVAGFEPTVIHVEHLVLVDIGLHLARRFGCPLVYRAHNIESQLWGRWLARRGRLFGPFVRRIARREARAIAACDLTLCISEVDRAWARAHAPGAAVEVLPVGLTFDRFAKPGGSNGVVDQQICFVGGLEWPPNEAGLRWFVEEVLPRVRAQMPEARLTVLARGAAERPWLTGDPGVEVLGPEAVPADLFASSCVSIAPLLEGGGVRVKILESLAAGCPVVATPIGGEGLELPALTHAADAASFADACVAQLRIGADPERRREITTSVRARHGAGVIGRQLVAAWAGLRSLQVR